MLYFYTESSPGVYVDDGYWYHGSPHEYDLFVEGQDERVAFLDLDANSRNELVGWLNGACNNL